MSDYFSPGSQLNKRKAPFSASDSLAKRKARSSFSAAGKRNLPSGLSEERQGVGKPGEANFTVDPQERRKSRLSKSNNLNYAKSGVSSSAKRKSSVRKASAASRSARQARKHSKMPLMLKLCWLICGLLALRLIFMERGVIDYYQMSSFLTEKKEYLVQVDGENEDLLKEIKKIKTSSSYQKKLARDHLSVIAQDEYLVLFAKERELSSR